MSGVRNLRAMFENKEDSRTSPPDRGRSPAGSTGGGSSGTSPRPLSKVRTSFVAVERNGQLGSQWGMRKESSTDSSLAERRMSFSLHKESDPKAMAEQKETISSELAARKASSVIAETIPETAVETPLESETKSSYMNGKAPLGRVALAASKPSVKPDAETSVQAEDTKLSLIDPTRSETVGEAAMTNGGRFRGTLNSKADGNTKPGAGTRSTAKSAPTDRSIKPAPITASMTINTKPILKPSKSPSAPKTPTTPGRSSRAPTSKPITSTNSTAPTKSLEKKISKPSLSSVNTSRPAGRPTTSSTVASAPETGSAHTSPSTGFHKPKPRSPTRPVKLPVSLTAPTNSSLSKVAPGALISSRQSLAPPTKGISRSPSRTSLGSKASNAQLRRKPSRLNENDRPALGRPSTSTVKRQPSRQSLSREPIIADESFLARMMRPTTSSASKTAEKIVTPPRKPVVARPIPDDIPPQLPGYSRDGLPYKTTMYIDSQDMTSRYRRFKKVACKSEDAHAAEPRLEDEKAGTFPSGYDKASSNSVMEDVETTVVKVPEVDTSVEEPVVPDIVNGKGKEVEKHEEELKHEVEVPVENSKELAVVDGGSVEEPQPKMPAPPKENEVPVEETKALAVDGSELEQPQPEATKENVEKSEDRQEAEDLKDRNEELPAKEEGQEKAEVVDPEPVTAA